LPYQESLHREILCQEMPQEPLHQDLHIHSTFSDGRMTPAEIAARAASQGFSAGLADHCLFYGPKTTEAFRQYMDAVSPLGLYIGLEIDLGRAVDLPSFVVQELDYIIGSVHHFALAEGQVLFSPYFKARRYGTPYEFPEELGDPRESLEAIGELIVTRLETDPVDILGHATVLPCCVPLGDEEAFGRDWNARVIRATVKNRVAIEISGLWRAPHREFLEMAVDAGAEFALGSDAHDEKGLFDIEYPIRMVTELGIPEPRLFVPHRRKPRIRR
jgi:histidinol phosphatase-like PHP family hydrolase